MGKVDTNSTESQDKIHGLAETLPPARHHAALEEISRLVAVLEAERDLLVSGKWEGLDAVLEEKEQRSRNLAELLSGLSAVEDPSSGGDVPVRNALLHLSELAAVNLVLARDSSLIVEQVMREISQEIEGGGTYGSSGAVGPGRPSPAMVSTRS